VLLDDIRAGDGDDVVTLQETNAYVFGGDGDDTLSADPYLPSDRSRLHGEAGNDTLVAGSANDARTELYGGEGDDRLIGHPGARLDGGAGSDRHVLWGGATGGAIGVAFARGSARDSITFGAEESGPTSDVRFEVRLPEAITATWSSSATARTSCCAFATATTGSPCPTSSRKAPRARA
jgi:Ca2+-binding RTX toxin-like protein